MPNLNNIEDWKVILGLLPIKLSAVRANENKYILLNGGSADFCLQLNEASKNPEFYYSSAWSSNTKNFVTLDADNVCVYNWRKSKQEILRNSLVSENIDKFYNYIVDNSFTTESDITPFVVNIFKKIRNLINDRDEGIESLNLLFHLLASLETDISTINHQQWGLVAANLPNDFNSYIEEFKSGLPGVKPNLELIIRHSAGTVFQEAQREVTFFNKQADLFSSTLSATYATKRKLYSSIHYTPVYLARSIVENTLNKIDIAKPRLKILDPACGCSEFLMEALKQLKSRNYAGQVEVIGWDSSQSAINTSTFLLTYETREWQGRLTVSLKKVGDSLTEMWDDDYDCILMNPPFVSWELMDKSSRDAVRDTLGPVFAGKPNQASAFIYKSIQCLCANGAIGSVIPTSLLTFDAYSKFRNSISEQASFSLVGKLGNFVFEDALTDVSIIIGIKAVTNQTPFVVWSKNDKGIASEALRNLRKVQYSNKQSKVSKDYSIYQPGVFPSVNQYWKVLSYKDNEFFKDVERFVAESKFVRVDDLFNVQQGIRSGLNNVFKISLREYEALPEREKQFFRPVVDNDSIERGVLSVMSFIWYPYDENGLTISDEADLQQKAPEFYQLKLLPNKQSLQRRAGIAEWWGLTRPRNWQFKKRRGICSTEFGKSDSFAFDKKGDFVIERGYAWLPKKKFLETDYYCYLAIFSSSIFDRLLSVYSKEILSGWDLGKKFTKNIPLPSIYLPEFKQSHVYEKLVEFGKALSNGELSTQYPIDELLSNFIYPSEKRQ